MRNTNFCESDLGKETAQLMKDGSLVPSTTVVTLLDDAVKEAESGSAFGLLVDGFPRTVEQAEIFEANTPATIVVNLVVPPEVLMERTRGRLCLGRSAFS